MRFTLKAFAVLCAAATLAPLAHAQTEFQQAQALYQAGTKPDITQLSLASGWAGHLLSPAGGVYGGALLTYPSTDPLANGATYMVDVLDTSDASVFINMTNAQMDTTYQQEEALITQEGFTPLVDNGDPLDQELSYTTEGGTVVYGVRQSVTAQGVPLYVVQATCNAPRGCRGVEGQLVAPGVVLGIIYVWESLLDPPTPTPTPTPTP